MNDLLQRMLDHIEENVMQHTYDDHHCISCGDRTHRDDCEAKALIDEAREILAEQKGHA